MNIENLKNLRQKISIPLKEAIALLETYKGDLIACEKAFHEQNIAKIIAATNCEKELAQKEYFIFKNDINKAIVRINNKPIIIARPYNIHEKIGFVLFPLKSNREYYNTERRNDVFIPSIDFDLIIEDFNAIYPITNPINKMIEHSIYIYGYNYFNKVDIIKIFERIKLRKANDNLEEDFFKKVIEWFEEKLAYADIIAVLGTL